jgi:hypothetical protein
VVVAAAVVVTVVVMALLLPWISLLPLVLLIPFLLLLLLLSLPLLLSLLLLLLLLLFRPGRHYRQNCRGPSHALWKAFCQRPRRRTCLHHMRLERARLAQIRLQVSLSAPPRAAPSTYSCDMV